MGAVGLNPIRLDAIGLDPIRFNAIRLGVPGASSATDRPYISPDVLSALAGVWISDGKSNTDPDRNIIKNKLPGRGGDFEIFNAAYKLNSGFGKYAEDFSTMKDYGTKGIVRTSSKIYLDESFDYDKGFWLGYTNSPSPTYKVRVSGIPKDGVLNYTGGSWINLINGINELPARTNTEEIHGFVAQTPNVDWSKLVIEQIPENEGSFVTDGVNDMIVSQNPVSEMLDGSKELTVVSMIHQISPVPDSYGFTNYIREGSIWSRTNVKTSGKTGIYGYKISKGNTEVGASNLINNILGDKADYEAMGYNITNYSDINYSVAGYIKDGSPTEVSSVAWYWTFIAKRVLTTDEINQVIAYYNLDKYVMPDILCDVKRQGITNENHAEFGDKLIDFSGNGRDIQLNNIAWKGDSGIGKYNVDFDSWIPQFNIADSVHTSNKLCVTRIKAPQAILYTRAKVNSMKVEVKGSQSLELFYQCVDKDDNMILLSLQGDGIYDLPASNASANNYYTGFRVSNYTGECDITITQIPSHAGALCFDGVDDYGQFVGDLGLKDYTVAVDRAYQDENVNCVPFISSVGRTGGAPFLMEMVHPTSHVTYPYSFGTPTESVVLNSSRQISYQSTYVYNRNSIARGNSVKTGDGLTIGSNEGVSQYSKLCLWSFLLFPYTLSEFLLERQLKKHKLGTLYPGMVEFRPIVKSNIPYSSITYSVNPGEYVIEGSTVTITITLSNSSDKLVDISSNAISDISISGDNGVYEVTGKITKSPQKINIVISSYLTMLDNETLITNETLIKNE